MLREYLSAAYTITCGDIGNCANKTKTIDQGITNITVLAISVVGMLAVVFLIYGGLQMTLSAGDPKRYQQGRQTLLYSVFGVVLAILAYGIVAFVAKAI